MIARALLVVLALGIVGVQKGEAVRGAPSAAATTGPLGSSASVTVAPVVPSRMDIWRFSTGPLTAMLTSGSCSG